MTTNNFDSVNEHERPSTPETRRNSISPPRLRRNGTCSALSSDSVIIRKYLHAEIEIENLKNELANCRAENRIHLSNQLKQSGVIVSYKNKISMIQELLFENSESIPNWIYVQLMNTLIVN